MESTNLPRTYTAQTCNLVITNEAGLSSQAKLDSAEPTLRDRVNRTNTGEFTLKIDRAEHSNADPIILNGQLDQLDKLQQTVSEYVAQLEPEAPIEIRDRHNIQPEVEDRFVESVVASQLYPESGIVKNLPGLRSKTSQLTTIQTIPSKESNPFSAANISKLLNRAKENSTLIAPDSPIAAPSAPTPTLGSTKLPRVTVGDRPLEYKLYLSDNNSGRVLTLSRMQLVDLATTLDKYTNETVAASSVAAQTVDFIETPKVYTPEIRTVKVETPKVYTPEIQTVKVETSKVHTPEIQTVKVETSKVHTPEIQTVKVETSKVHTPEIRTAKIETSKIDEDAKLPSVVTASALSRLPNLPTIPSKINTDRSYDYDDDSQPAFMSALPWLAAAAVVVGVPFLLVSANPNLLKESMAKVKMPTDPRQLLEGKKEDPQVTPPQPATNPSGDVANAAATANVPKPWETQPVVPPTNPAPIGSPIPQPPAGADGIGIAPLPPTIANIPEQAALPQDMPTETPGDSGAAMASVPPQQNKTASGIAPNPLGASSIAQGFDTPKPQQQLPVTTAKVNIPVIPAVTQPKATKSATTVAKSKATKPATTVASKSQGIISIIGSVDQTAKATKIKAVPSKQNNQLSVSSQPMSLPNDLGAMSNEPPLTPPPFPAAKVVTPAPIAPVKQYKKVVKAKAKPIVIAKKSVTPIANPVAKKAVNTIARKAVRVIPVQTPEPITVPEFTNPSISENTAPQVVPPIVNEPELQSNNNQNPAPFDNPSLNETKRYFQSKWRADLNQSSPLQYVVQFNPKSGVVQSVDPQGEASTTYLKKTGVIKTGQKLVSPITSGEGDQKIRVLLQPDGNVETFIEP
jgi:hypothetical protein